VATHVFTIRSSVGYNYTTGPYDLCFIRYGGTYTAVRDATDDNYGLLRASTHYVGQGDAINAIYRCFLYFTMPNALAGATVQSASLNIKVHTTVSGTDFDIVIQRGTEVDEYNQPIVHSIPYNISEYDRTLLLQTSDGGSVNTSGAVVNSFLSIPLNETGISWVNLTKDIISKLCLRSAEDIAGNIWTGEDWLFFYSGNTSTTANKPYLTLTVVLAIPTAVTNDATDIAYTSGRFNGEITDIGYWIDNYGFEWKEGVGGDVTSVTIGGANQNITTFSYLKTGLSEGTTYYFRAWGNNDAGKGYGEWVEFTTLSYAPVVTTQAATEIDYCRAIGNGTIVSGSDITERGFEVKILFSGRLADYIHHEFAGFEGDHTIINNEFVATMVKTESETGTYTAGVYELVLGYSSELSACSAFWDKLFPCESYTYRAYATNDVGTGYGAYVAFDTLCDDDAPPTDDISEGDPVVPIIPIEDEPEYPPFEWEYPPLEPYPPWNWDIPDWEMPDYPPWSWVGDFYYRKPYTKKDLDDLRRKCIIYNKNSVEFALVLRHNMNVLREFFNMMTDYMDKEEFNDFTDLVPPQRLKELYLDPLEVNDFRDMINGFIRNNIDNNIAVNRNFSLIQAGLSDYETESDDAYFRDIYSAMRTITEDNPDVHRLKRVIDNLNQEVGSNFYEIMRNLEILRARLL